MTLKKQLIAGALALAIGSSVAIPTTSRADDWWHHHDSHEGSWWDRDHDRDRDYRNRDRDYHPDWDRERDWSYNHPGYRYYNPNFQRHIPPNGQGMINRRNPNLYWSCDSDGHHCHWARR